MIGSSSDGYTKSVTPLACRMLTLLVVGTTSSWSACFRIILAVLGSHLSKSLKKEQGADIEFLASGLTFTF